jgi:deoxyhypusine synthase
MDKMEFNIFACNLIYHKTNKKMKKKDLLKDPVKHFDIKKVNTIPVIDAMRDMSFTSRDTAAAADILNRMIKDKGCTIFLTIAGSTSAGGCMQVYVDMVNNNMVDAIIATGASIVDMDFFEALGFKHYKGSYNVDDKELRGLYIDRIYDTYIDEEELQACDMTVAKIADSLEPRPYSSREFIWEITSKRTRKRKIHLSRRVMKTMFLFSVLHSATAAPVSDSSSTNGPILKSMSRLIRLKISSN